jgi:hypothetical protein
VQLIIHSKINDAFDAKVLDVRKILWSILEKRVIAPDVSFMSRQQFIWHVRNRCPEFRLFAGQRPVPDELIVVL